MLETLYAARVDLQGAQAQIIQVLAINDRVGLVGRDFLNWLRLQLDGPALALSLL